jgi:hypothetical protein
MTVTVLVVMQLIADRTGGIPVERQRLVYGQYSRLLRPARTLASYSINEFSTIRITVWDAVGLCGGDPSTNTSVLGDILLEEPVDVDMPELTESSDDSDEDIEVEVDLLEVIEHATHLLTDNPVEYPNLPALIAELSSWMSNPGEVLDLPEDLPVDLPALVDLEPDDLVDEDGNVGHGFDLVYLRFWDATDTSLPPEPSDGIDHRSEMWQGRLFRTLPMYRRRVRDVPGPASDPNAVSESGLHEHKEPDVAVEGVLTTVEMSSAAISLLSLSDVGDDMEKEKLPVLPPPPPLSQGWVVITTSDNGGWVEDLTEFGCVEPHPGPGRQGEPQNASPTFNDGKRRSESLSPYENNKRKKTVSAMGPPASSLSSLSSSGTHQEQKTVNSEVYLAKEESASELRDILDLALRRERRKLSHDTVYSHAEIIGYLKRLLPEWEVQHPSQLGDGVMVNWPGEDQMQGVVDWLTKKGCTDPPDLLAGACESLTIYGNALIRQALRLPTVKASDNLADIVHARVVGRLKAMQVHEAAEVIFGNISRNQWKTGINLWCESLGLEATSPGVVPIDYLYGSPAADETIRRAAVLAVRTGTASTIPLYVLTYIFDGDELNEKDMRVKDYETAQYSCHVLGLVLDPTSFSIIIIDANGALVPGASMEFLSMPLSHRRASPSTCVSQYDVDVRLRPTAVVARPTHAHAGERFGDATGVVTDTAHTSPGRQPTAPASAPASSTSMMSKEQKTSSSVGRRTGIATPVSQGDCGASCVEIERYLDQFHNEFAEGEVVVPNYWDIRDQRQESLDSTGVLLLPMMVSPSQWRAIAIDYDHNLVWTIGFRSKTYRALRGWKDTCNGTSVLPAWLIHDVCHLNFTDITLPEHRESVCAARVAVYLKWFGYVRPRSNTKTIVFDSTVFLEEVDALMALWRSRSNMELEDATSSVRPPSNAVISGRTPLSPTGDMTCLPDDVLASSLFPCLDLGTLMRVGLTCHHLCDRAHPFTSSSGSIVPASESLVNAMAKMHGAPIYTIFGVDRWDLGNSAVMWRAYHRALWRYHPDRQRGVRRATESFHVIIDAWERLELCFVHGSTRQFWSPHDSSDSESDSSDSSDEGGPRCQKVSAARPPLPPFPPPPAPPSPPPPPPPKRLKKGTDSHSSDWDWSDAGLPTHAHAADRIDEVSCLTGISGAPPNEVIYSDDYVDSSLFGLVSSLFPYLDLVTLVRLGLTCHHLGAWARIKIIMSRVEPVLDAGVSLDMEPGDTVSSGVVPSVISLLSLSAVGDDPEPREEQPTLEVAVAVVRPTSVRAPLARGMAYLPGGVLASAIFPYLDLVTHMRLGVTCHYLHANSAMSRGSTEDTDMDTHPWTKMIRLPSTGLSDEAFRGMEKMHYSFTAVDLNGISGAAPNGVIYSDPYLNFILGLPLVKLKLCVNETSLLLLNTATWAVVTGRSAPNPSGFLYTRTLQTLSMAFAPGISGHPSRKTLMEFLQRCANLQTFVACQCILNNLGYPDDLTFRVRVKIGGCCGHCRPSSPSETEIAVMAGRLGCEPHVIFGVDSHDRDNRLKMTLAYSRTLRRFIGVPRGSEAWVVIKDTQARLSVDTEYLPMQYIGGYESDTERRVWDHFGWVDVDFGIPELHSPELRSPSPPVDTS